MKNSLNSDSLDCLQSRLRSYVGECVVIEWKDPADDWPTFQILRVDMARNRVWLRGQDDEEGNKHDGNEFWVAVADIKRVRLRADILSGKQLLTRLLPSLFALLALTGCGSLIPTIQRTSTTPTTTEATQERTVTSPGVRKLKITVTPPGDPLRGSVPENSGVLLREGVTP